jgi:hypothetical protein
VVRGSGPIAHRDRRCTDVDHDSQIIYSTIRVVSDEELEWHLDDCINLKKEFPHTIAGVCSPNRCLRLADLGMKVSTWLEMRTC